MILGVNFLCKTGHVEKVHFPLLDLAKDAGFDSVEIPVLEGSPNHYMEIGRELDSRQLRRTCTAIIPSPEANPVSADADTRSQGIKHLNWILECAAALGAECIGGPFHSPIGHFTGQGPQSEELKRGADAHHEFAEKAHIAGIKLALEPLNRFETYFLNTASQAKSYCEMVDHPNFGIMYDTFHAHIEEKSQSDAINTLAGHINVLHVSENDRGIPGTGQIDFGEVFSSMKAQDFSGWVVVEAFGNSIPSLAAATKIWRPMFESMDKLFNDSARFVKEEWAKS